MSYDLETLRAHLPPELLDLVTHRQVDRNRVEAAGALGSIAPDVLDRARRITKRKPQLRVRR